MIAVEPFAAGCATEPDGTASCWLHDRYDLLRGKAGWQAEGGVLRVAWRDRDATGSAIVQRNVSYAPAPPTDAEAASARMPGHPGLAFFLLDMEQVESLVREGNRSPWAANFGVRCEAASFGEGLAGLGFDRRALESLAGALQALDPFLSGLDPDARPLVRERAAQVGSRGMGAGRVDPYPGLDRTFGTGAPLAAAWGWLPNLRSASARMYAADPTAFAALAAGGEARIRAAVADALSRVDGPRAAKLALRCADALSAMDPHAVEGFRHDVGTGSDDPEKDAAARAGAALARLPGDWCPRTPEGWAWFGRCFPAVAWAVGLAGDAAGAMLNARGDWEAFARRLAAAHGGRDRRTALEDAVRDVRDMAKAFRDQSLAPAAALAGMAAKPPALENAAWETLFSGRGACRILEMSRDWHGRNDAMLDALPDGGVTSSWERVLPDAEVAGVTVRVLADRASLRAEGATGRDRAGASGLAHCVGGYAGRCLEGSCRILSLRAGPGPDAPRLSTAEIAWRGGHAAERQHRGRRNGEPAPEAVAALDAYLAGLASGALRASSPDLPKVDAGDAVTRLCGYDWRRPGHWEAAHALWAHYLPDRLRRAPAGEVAALAMARGSGRATWRIGGGYGHGGEPL